MAEGNDEITGVFDLDIDIDEEALSAEERARVIAGRYEIVERIGEGGMGQVLHVRHRRLGKSFALKLMQAEFTFDPASRDVFHREARLASSLSHPGIVSIVDFGEDPDWGLFIVMEYLEGELLSDRIEALDKLPVEVVCDVTAQLADALDHSHSRAIVHGDLKPDNVVCLKPQSSERRKWGIKLLDYGMAQVATAPGASEGRIAGTPEYMAPERITGGVPQPSVDIYALGVMMYEMLTGRVPFSGGEPTEILQRHLTETPTPVSTARGEALDEALVAVVDRALAKSVDDRYPDVISLTGDLRAYMDRRGLRRRTRARRAATEPGETRTDAAAAAFDALPVPAAGVRGDGLIVVANPRLVRLFGKESADDLEGQSIMTTALARLHPGLREDLRLVAMDGKVARRSLYFTARDRRVVRMRLAMTPTHGSCGHCLIVLYPIPGRA